MNGRRPGWEGHLAPEDGDLVGWLRCAADDWAIPYGRLVQGPRALGTVVGARFRPDLLERGIGHGWYGFRLGAPALEEGEVSLVAQESGAVVATCRVVRPTSPADGAPLTLADFLARAALAVEEAASLRGAAPLLDRFRAIHGVEAFVDRAHAYVLGAPADRATLLLHAAELQAGETTPLDVLAGLFDRPGRSPAWRVVPPGDPSFPFRTAA